MLVVRDKPQERRGVVTERKTALVSPDDVNGFLAAIQAAAPVSLSSTTGRDEDRQRSGLGGVGTFVGAMVAVLVVAVVILAFTYSPGPPSYTLTASTQHTRPLLSRYCECRSRGCRPYSGSGHRQGTGLATDEPH